MPGKERSTDTGHGEDRGAAAGRPGPEPEPGAQAGDRGQREADPDARLTFANERTFLAWSRTSLALVAAGLAIVQLLPPFPGVPWGRHVIGTPLIVLGSAVSVLSYLEWRGNQSALRRGEPPARSRLPVILAVTIAVIGLLAAAVALFSTATRQ